MSQLFHINKMANTARGAGLPFLNKKEYQHRFNEFTDSTPVGYWMVPQNKLPTFEVWVSNTITLVDVYLIPVDGTDDGFPMLIYYHGVTGGTCFSHPTDPTKKVYWSRYPNSDFRLSVPCGLYYLRLDFDDSSRLYSEVFIIGGEVCAVNMGLGIVADSVNMDGTANCTVTVESSNHPSIRPTLSYLSKIPIVPLNTYSTKVFAHTFPVGITEMSTQITTTYCGVFTMYWTINNDGLGNVSYTLKTTP